MIANETTIHKRPKMTQKLTTIDHRTAFNKEQSPYRIVVTTITTTIPNDVNFSFSIVNFPFLSSNTPAAPPYGVLEHNRFILSLDF